MSRFTSCIKTINGRPSYDNQPAQQGFDLADIVFDGHMVTFEGKSKHREVKIIGEYGKANMTVTTHYQDASMVGNGLMYLPQNPRVMLNIEIELTKITEHIKDIPTKMTLEEIEKKLGFKVLVTSEKEGD